MRYLSLFSGIEAATQAWQPLGWECVAVSEIEPFPCAVLEHHYPNVPNLGDVTKITEQQIKDLGQIDLVVFGSPCQNLSVAGNRKGFEGEQSSLFYAAMEIIKYAKQHCNTRFALWENVPGAFSSNKGADFTEVVKHMAGLTDIDTPKNGWGKEGAALGEHGLLEWACLDAQWFGLAQRRKRVFAIVDFGDWTSRPPILLERESLRGNSAPSRETRESAASDVGASTASSINFRAFGARVESELVGTLTAKDYKEPHGVMIEPVAYPINTMTCQGRPSDNGRMGLGLGDANDPCPTITSAHSHAVALAFKERAGCAGGGKGFLGKEECAFTLSTVRDQSVFIPSSTVAYGGCLNPDQPQCWRVYETDGVAPALQAGEGRGNAILEKEIAYSIVADTTPKIGVEINGTLRASGGGGIVPPSVAIGSVVRRLTPIECERLQGFKPIIEGVTYKLCLDHQSKSARVEVKCHRSQSSVIIADEKELLRIAKIVEASFSTSPADQDLLVVQNVPQIYETSAQKKPNVEKLKSNASGVEAENSYRHQIAIEDFAPVLATILQALAKTQLTGREVSQANIKPSTHRGHGSSSVEIFGLDIEASAEDAILDLNGEKYTISGLGQNTLMTGCEIATLFYCATNAISGCIPRKINKEIFYIHLTNVSGFTKIPYRNKSADDCPLGVRYKALGNSMAVNVMAWIGQSINNATSNKEHYHE